MFMILPHGGVICTDFRLFIRIGHNKQSFRTLGRSFVFVQQKQKFRMKAKHKGSKMMKKCKYDKELLDYSEIRYNKITISLG